MELNRTHPLILTASAAIIITCGVAVASMTGLLPSSRAEERNKAEVISTDTEKLKESQEKGPAEIPPLVPTQQRTQAYAPSAPMYDAPPAAQQVAQVCHSCGRVVAVHPIKIQGEGTGIGAVAGGVAGALLGKQFGNGNGQKALTVAGAVGGAYLGNNIEKDRRSHTVYDVMVRFEDGRSHKYRVSHADWQVGDRVRVNNGRLSADS